jgi:nucleotide-binding universal stress UspA family protein
MNQESAPILHLPLLVATDGSPSARMAQQLLYPIAPILAEDEPDIPLITLLTVVPQSKRRLRRSTSDASNQPLEAPTPAQSAPSIASDPEQMLHTLQADIPATIRVAAAVRQGRPAVEILACARTQQAGLIAIGHRGIGGMQELLLGSVSTVIARYAPCSVLIARATEETKSIPSWNHVLLVVDKTGVTTQAIAAIQQLLAVGIQRVTAVCVQPPVASNYLYGPLFTPTPSWQFNQSLQEVQKEEVEQLLHQVKETLGREGTVIDTEWHIGEAGPTICQIAQQLKVNVILTGSDAARKSLLNPLNSLRKSSRTDGSGVSLRNTRLTPTEDYLIHHAPCAVLLCRRAIMR